MKRAGGGKRVNIDELTVEDVMKAGQVMYERSMPGSPHKRAEVQWIHKNVLTTYGAHIDS